MAGTLVVEVVDAFGLVVVVDDELVGVVSPRIVTVMGAACSCSLDSDVSNIDSAKVETPTAGFEVTSCGSHLLSVPVVVMRPRAGTEIAPESPKHGWSGYPTLLPAASRNVTSLRHPAVGVKMNA